MTERGAFQKKLLARMRGLGMTAVLSSFSGHIPKAFADKHPEAKIRRSPNWGLQQRSSRACCALLSEKGTLGAVPQFRYDLIDFARQALELNFSTQKNLFQKQATQNNASVTLNTSGCSIWDVIWDVICLAKQMLQHA